MEKRDKITNFGWFIKSELCKSVYNFCALLVDNHCVLRNLPLWSALDSSALDSITLDKGKLKKLILRNHPISSALGFKYDSRHLLRCLEWSTLHKGFVLESSVLEFHKIAFLSSALDHEVCLIIKYTWMLIKSCFFQVHFNHAWNYYKIQVYLIRDGS